MKVASGIKFKNKYTVVCRKADGSIRWIEEFENLVPDPAINNLLDIHLGATAKTAAWYLGLKGAGSAAAGDTMASHAGWSEVTSYDEAARQTCVFGSASSKSISNSASPAVFTISGTVTVAGLFLTSVSTKGGATGTLFSAGDFGSSRAVQDNDTLTVTYTVTGASS